jgi:hypothetical protein
MWIRVMLRPPMASAARLSSMASVGLGYVIMASGSIASADATKVAIPNLILRAQPAYTISKIYKTLSAAYLHVPRNERGAG